jgi:archaemetzincin
MKRIQVIRIYPVGSTDPALIRRFGKRLRRITGWNCSIENSVDIPDDIFDPKRKQYRADLLLGVVLPKEDLPGSLILLITCQDLTVPGLNFVFGVAGGNRALISTARLREEFYGRVPDEERLVTRMVTEAVHEIGHCLGLFHCPHPGCVMFFSNSLRDTDRKQSAFCPDCRSRVEH